jgi:hypothetical protein
MKILKIILSIILTIVFTSAIMVSIIDNNPFASGGWLTAMLWFYIAITNEQREENI